MGKVKLTLSVDEKVVAIAKLQAKRQQKSLSKLIEDMLVPKEIGLPDSVPAEPVALKLRGIAKGSFSRKTDRQLRDMMYKDRYGL